MRVTVKPKFVFKFNNGKMQALFNNCRYPYADSSRTEGWAYRIWLVNTKYGLAAVTSGYDYPRSALQLKNWEISDNLFKNFINNSPTTPPINEVKDYADKLILDLITSNIESEVLINDKH